MAKKCKKKSGTHKKRKSKKHDLYPGQAHIPQPSPLWSGSKSPETEQEHPEPTEEQNKDTKSTKDANETAKLRFRAIVLIILLIYIGALFFKPEAAPDLKSILDKLIPVAITSLAT